MTPSVADEQLVMDGIAVHKDYRGSFESLIRPLTTDGVSNDFTHSCLCRVSPRLSS